MEHGNNFSMHFYDRLKKHERDLRLSSPEGFIWGQHDGKLMRFGQESGPFYTVSCEPELRERHSAIPNTLTHPGSVLSISVGKRTIEETLSFRRDVLKQKIYVYDPYDVTDKHNCSINPLDGINEHKTTDAHNLAKILLQEVSDGAPATQREYDRHHPTEMNRTMLLAAELAEDLLTATILYVTTASSEEIPEEKRTLSFVRELLGQPSKGWQKLIRRLQNDDGSYKHILNYAGERFRENETQPTSLASYLAYSPLHDFPDKNKILAPYFHLSNLRNEQATLYIVMPDYKTLHFNNKWLRSVIEMAESACPQIISSPDEHRSLRHSDRILFMIDDYCALGRLSAGMGELHSSYTKGITHWGLTAYIDDSSNVYGDFCISPNNPRVQMLDLYNEYGMHLGPMNGEEVMACVRREVIENPPRPASQKTCLPVASPQLNK